MFNQRHLYRRDIDRTTTAAAAKMPSLCQLLFTSYTRDAISDYTLRAVEQSDIYSLPGLASDAETLGIRPDYKLDWRDVHAEALTALLCQDNISILVIAQAGYEGGGLITILVVDWRQGANESPSISINMHSMVRSVRGKGNNRVAPFRAS